MIPLLVQDLVQSFGPRRVLDGLDLRLEAGRIAVLLGPSGSGKTSLLRVIAGLAEPDAGRVELFGKVANDPRSRLLPAQRQVGMVFQHDALWPHFTVLEHLRYVLARRAGAAEAARLLALVRLEGFDSRHPATLSGGERQRLSLARALARRPRLLLLDEPTRHLDAHLARELRAEFRGVLGREGVTALWVTHDQEEAFECADEVLVLSGGRIAARGTPESIYRTPPDAVVARLLGPLVLLAGRVASGGRVHTALGDFPAELAAGTCCSVGFRPEDLVVVAPGAGIAGEVIDTRFDGALARARIRLDGSGGPDEIVEVRAAHESGDRHGGAAWRAGQRVGVRARGGPLFVEPLLASGRAR